MNLNLEILIKSNLNLICSPFFIFIAFVNEFFKHPHKKDH